jgi:hypothetical protein
LLIDYKKDMTVKHGQAKSKLYHADVNWNFRDDTVGGVQYTIVLKDLKAIHQKSQSLCPDLVQGMVEMDLEAAKDGSTSSLYPKEATIHILQKSMTTNLLNRNLKIARLATSTPMCLFSIPQPSCSSVTTQRSVTSTITSNITRTHILRIYLTTRVLIPKTTIKNIGTIDSLGDISYLVFNTANLASSHFDVTTIKANDTLCLLDGLAEYFLDLTSGEFSGWCCQKHINRSSIHITLYQYYDAVHLHIYKFSTNFENVNVLKTDHTASKLNLISLTKTAVIIKTATEHSHCLVALGFPDATAASLSPVSTTRHLSFAADATCPSKHTARAPEGQDEHNHIRRHGLQM